MTLPCHPVGAFVRGAPTNPRILVRHDDLLRAYTDGDVADEGEAYLSHFIFGPELVAHFKAHRNSVAGYAGPCGARWLYFDIDRTDRNEAVEDCRQLVRTIQQRYPALEGDVPIYFSGSKGFHVLIELAHRPPPCVGFQNVARMFAESLAAQAGVRVDSAIYDLNRIVRAPNSKHPKTGLFKRRIETEALFGLSLEGILGMAKHPSGDGLPTVRGPVPQLAQDWRDAEQAAARKREARAVVRHDGAAGNARAPKYLLDFLRFGTDAGERARTLFRCAAWLTEHGAPPALVSALLTEPGCDVGLAPSEVARQIQCGITHAAKQAAADALPDPTNADACERWCIQREADPLPPGALDFPFGALAPQPDEGRAS